RALLRHGEPRAPERARGGVRLGGDAGSEEGSGDGAAGRVRGARFGSAGARQIPLELHETSPLPTCETDASRLEQILVNLLGNAVHHAPDASAIRVGVATRGGMVEYLVDDEGPGVPESEVERIFDIYVTKAAGESRGAGLGLPLSRRL